MSHSVVEMGENRRKKEAIDQLVGEIAKGSDESVATTVRMAIERGWRLRVMDVLKEARRRKELDITKIKTRHYTDFEVSVLSMLELQAQTSDLIKQVTAVNQEFQSTRSNLVTISDELNTAQTEREKMRSVLDSVISCQQVVNLMVEARNYIESHSHYAAMATIESIQGHQATLQKANITIKPLNQYLNSWLPLMTYKLLNTVRLDSQESIQTIRLENHLIGETLLRKCASQLTNDLRLNLQTIHSQIQLCTVNPSLSVCAIYACSSQLRFDQWIEKGEFDSIIPSHFIDDPNQQGLNYINNELPQRLGNVYKAAYIYYNLNHGQEFDDFYRLSREDAEEMAGYQSLASIMPNLLATIVGFFTVEFTLKHGISSLSKNSSLIGDQNKNQVTKLSTVKSTKKKKNNNTKTGKSLRDRAIYPLDKSMEYLHAFISRHLKSISTTEQLLQIKEELVLLSELVVDDLFNLRPHGIYEIVRSLWTNFESLQIRTVNASVAYSLQHGTFQAFFVSTPDIYRKKIAAYRLDTLSLEPAQMGTKNSRSSLSPTNALMNATLDALEADMGIQNLSTVKTTTGGESFTTSSSFASQTFAFSEVVPDILRELHLTITRFFLFACENPHLGSRGESLCNSIRKLYESIAYTLKQGLTSDGSDTPLSKACQISIDAAAFAQSSDIIFQILEPMLERFRWSESIDVHLPTTINSIKNTLIQISIQAQDLIFELLTNKIDDLLGSLVFINFVPTSASSGNITHESIDEIIDFLKVTFLWLTHLPQSARDAAHFTSCSKVANGILGFLLSPQVTAINLFCVLILDNDIKKLVNFANNCGIPHLKQCFQELGDIVKILLNPDLMSFLENFEKRKSQYPKLDVNKLIVILEKLVPTPVGASQMNLTRIDQKAIKNLIKRIKH